MTFHFKWSRWRTNWLASRFANGDNKTFVYYRTVSFIILFSFILILRTSNPCLVCEHASWMSTEYLGFVFVSRLFPCVGRFFRWVDFDLHEAPRPHPVVCFSPFWFSRGWTRICLPTLWSSFLSSASRLAILILLSLSRYECCYRPAFSGLKTALRRPMRLFRFTTCRD